MKPFFKTNICKKCGTDMLREGRIATCKCESVFKFQDQYFGNVHELTVNYIKNEKVNTKLRKAKSLPFKFVLHSSKKLTKYESDDARKLARILRRSASDNFRHSEGSNHKGGNYYIIDYGKPTVAGFRCEWICYSGYREENIHESTAFYLRFSKTNDLLVADNIINLYSKKQKVPDGYPQGSEIYRATWVRQDGPVIGSIKIEEGWIAKYRNLTYHYADREYTKKTVRNSTIEKKKKALDGVHRKHKRQANAKKERKVKEQDFRESIPQDLLLAFKDSINAGNCAVGTENFCIRHGLKKKKRYPARFIYDMEPKNRQLKLVIKYALRKYKKNKVA